MDEKGLCRAMKECYKGSGYEVAMVSGYDLELATRTECDGATGEVQEAEEDRYIIMSGPSWMTWCFLPEVPRKVLGLIVEHMGSIPMEDHAYRVMKSNTQEEMTDLLVNAYIRHRGGEKSENAYFPNRRCIEHHSIQGYGANHRCERRPYSV